MMKSMLLIVWLWSLAIPALASAQEKTAGEIAAELANPNNSLATLTLKNQYYWYEGGLPGAGDEGNFALFFQPVFPFTLGEGRNIFVRPAFPVVFDQPSFVGGTKNFEGVTGSASSPSRWRSSSTTTSRSPTSSGRRRWSASTSARWSRTCSTTGSIGNEKQRSRNEHHCQNCCLRIARLCIARTGLQYG